MADDKHVRRSGEDYGTAFLTLLPQGQAWPKHPGTTLDLACRGLAEYWGYVDGRAADLLEIESDPRKTRDYTLPDGSPDGLLDDWERNWQLPDPCEVYPPETVPERQDELVYKMTLLGRQDRQFFIDLAARQGETVTIREYAPYMCGVSWVGDSRGMNPTTGQVSDTDPDGDPNFRWQLGPQEMRFYWLVDLEHVLSGVECIFTRYGPGHGDVVFTYRSKLDRSINLYPWLMV